MDVYYGFGKIWKINNAVLVVGIFDGLHKGHQKLLSLARRLASSCQGEVVVMTFAPHPVHVLRPEEYAPLVISLPYRLRLLREYGVNACVVVPFTKRFSRLSPGQFLERYVWKKIRPAAVVVGDDFLFGSDRRGTKETLTAFGLRYGVIVRTVSTRVGGEKRYSSSKLRRLIATGRLAEAKKILGRPVSILGRVVHGDERGATLGFPTANIHPAYEVLPPSGIYLVNVIIDGKRYHGLANVGRCPTFKRLSKVSVEVFILRFHKDIYGQEIVVEFVKKIRDEKVFQSVRELVEQMQVDRSQAMKFFKIRT